MSLLTLNAGACVRSTNKFSICDACVDVCPVETIKIDKDLFPSIPSFVPNDCVGCGGCNAVCPSSAYTLDNFNALNFTFAFLEADTNVIDCKDKKQAIPCIAALSAEEMLSLSLLSAEEIIYNSIHCKECDIAKKNFDIIEERIEEVNFLLEGMGQSKRTTFKEVEAQSEEEIKSRRDMLKNISLKEAAQAKQKFENSVEALDEELKVHALGLDDIKSIRQKVVPDKRKLLMMAMKRADIPETFHVIESEDISFMSQKVLDFDACTNCQICYRVCPTGSLSSDDKGSFIKFDAFSCIKCHTCHDVCEPNAIKLKETFNLKELFEPSKELLAKFTIKRCNECGLPFTYRGGEVICTRCEIEENEAKEIWGIE